MQLQRFQDAKQFYQRSQDYLLSHEAHNSLLFAIASMLLHHPDRYPFPPYLAIVEDEDQVVAVAMRTPPRKLVLSKMADLQAAELIAQDVLQHQKSLPGVLSLVAEAQAFVSAWEALTQQPHKVALDLRVHQLQSVQPVTKAAGYLRQATERDRDLLVQWNHDFMLEAFGALEEDPEKMAERQIHRGVAYLWQDQVPVSMACARPSTPKGATIGPVYTPSEYRGKGYATACVAALSQQLLDQGCHSCFLFTDLANPTSNHIYQKIGYRPVTDWRDYSFENLA
uniref:GNAT family N-acetyltransferase n=1 Tax=Trichocoleus desertorum TaxID=1481672 RepID=UPI0025B52B78|nr:GNAT family N-acetyltransferase [Trichocoleus desertorum]